MPVKHYPADYMPYKPFQNPTLLPQTFWGAAFWGSFMEMLDYDPHSRRAVNALRDMKNYSIEIENRKITMENTERHYFYSPKPDRVTATFYAMKAPEKHMLLERAQEFYEAEWNPQAAEDFLEWLYSPQMNLIPRYGSIRMPKPSRSYWSYSVSYTQEQMALVRYCALMCDYDPFFPLILHGENPGMMLLSNGYEPLNACYLAYNPVSIMPEVFHAQKIVRQSRKVPADIAGTAFQTEDMDVSYEKGRYEPAAAYIQYNEEQGKEITQEEIEHFSFLESIAPESTSLPESVKVKTTKPARKKTIIRVWDTRTNTRFGDFASITRFKQAFGIDDSDYARTIVDDLHYVRGYYVARVPADEL